MKSKILLVLRVIVGAVFVISGFMKLIAPYENFLAEIHEFQILEGPAAVWLAKGLPWIEFYAGLFLVLGLWPNAALIVVWALNSSFVGVVGQALARKLPIGECGCFGALVTLKPSQILALDIGIWVACLFLFIFRKHE